MTKISAIARLGPSKIRSWLIRRIAPCQTWTGFAGYGLALGLGIGLLAIPTAASGAVNWDGGGDRRSWGDAKNWTNDKLPGPKDDVAISVSVPAITVTVPNVLINSLVTANSLVCAGDSFETTESIVVNQGMLTLNQGRLTTGTGLTIKKAGLTVNQGTIHGPVELELATLSLATGLKGETDFVLRGQSSFSGEVAAGHRLWIQGHGRGGHAVLTMEGVVKNRGVILLETLEGSIYRSSLHLAEGGSLDNLEGAKLLVNKGVGGRRIIEGPVTNRGEFSIGTDTKLEGNGDWTNTGSLEVLSGATWDHRGSLQNQGTIGIAKLATLDLDLKGEGRLFQGAGGITVEATGELNVVNGTVEYLGGKWEGTFVLEDLHLALGSKATHPAELIMRGVGSFTGAIAPGQLLWIQGGSDGGSATITVIDDLNNQGTIRLASLNSAIYRSILQLGTDGQGNLVNLADGLIEIKLGTGGIRRLAANLINNAELRIDPEVKLEFDGSLDNRNLITVEKGATLDLDGQLFNAGDLNIAAGSLMVDLESRGMVVQNNGNITVDPAGTAEIMNGSVEYNGGRLTGRFVLEKVNLTLKPEATHPAEFIVRGTSQFRGNLAPDQRLWIQGSSAGGSATCQVFGEVRNQGTLRLESINSAIYNSTLIQADGQLINEPGARIEVNAGNGGRRTIETDVINRGSLVIESGTTLEYEGRLDNLGFLTIGQQGSLEATGSFSNQGLVILDPLASWEFDLAKSGSFGQSAGLIQTSDGSLFAVANGAVQLEGGALPGSMTFIDTQLTLADAATGETTFICRGETNFRGDLKANQAMWIRGGDRSGHAVLTAEKGLLNRGTILLETVNSQIWRSTLIVENGPLIIADGAQLSVPPGSGGSRRLEGEVFNQGTVDIGTGVSLALVGQWANEGDFTWGKGAEGNLNGGMTNRGVIDLAPSVVWEINLGGNHQFHQTQGEVVLDPLSTLSIQNGAVILEAGNIGARVWLDTVVLAVAPKITNPVEWIVRGESSFAGDIGANQVLWIQAGSDGGHATVTAPKSFVNRGRIIWQSVNSSIWRSTLVIRDPGVLTNAAEGRLEFNLGTGGTHFLRGNLINLGTVEFEGQTINTWEGKTTNRGSIAAGAKAEVNHAGTLENDALLDLGDQTVWRGNLKGGYYFRQNAGELRLSKTTKASWENGRFELLGGTTANEITLRNVLLTLSPRAEGSTQWILQGKNRLLSDVPSPHRLWVQGGGDGHGVLEGPPDFINQGTIRLESASSTIWHSTLLTPRGECINQGIVQVEAGSGGRRSLGTQLNNQGLLLVRYPVVIGRRQVDHHNEGTITLDNADIQWIGDTFVNLPQGIIEGTGALQVSLVSFENRGAIRPGMPIGKLEVEGDFLQTDSGEITCAIAAAQPTKRFDQLAVNGVATLGGTFTVISEDNYAPQLADFFHVLLHGKRQGMFANLNLPERLGPPIFDAFYHARSLTVYAVQTSIQPPEITQSPTDLTVNLGDTATFAAEAAGTPPLRYQWRKNGVKLEDENAALLVLENVALRNAGRYEVIVASPFGVATSDPARLLLESQDIIGLQLEDHFENRATFSQLTANSLGTNRGATRQAGEPRHDGKPGNHSVWLTLRFPVSGVLTLATSGSSFDTLLAVYTGTTLAKLKRVASDDDRGGQLTSKLRINVQANVEYHVAIDGLGDAQGEIALAWVLEPDLPPLPIIVDHPQGLVVSPNESARMDVVAEGQDLFYEWQLNDQSIPDSNRTQMMLAETKPSNVGTFTVTVSNDAGTVKSRPARLEIGEANTALTQRKLVDLISLASPLLQGETGSPWRPHSFTSVSAGTLGTQIFSNFGATTETGEPDHAGVIGGASTWFGIEPEEDGILQVDTAGSEVDTVLAVYTGSSLLDLELVAEDNDAGDDGTSRVSFPAEQGQKYMVAVDTLDGDTGTIHLNWQLGTEPMITQPPADQLVDPGADVSFMVVVEGSPTPTIQWQWNGIDLEGQQNLELILEDIEESQAGFYGVVVENFVGRQASIEAELTLTGGELIPLSIESAGWQESGHFGFQVTLIQETTLQVEASDDLQVWETIIDLTVPAGPWQFEDDASLEHSARFYRIRQGN